MKNRIKFSLLTGMAFLVCTALPGILSMRNQILYAAEQQEIKDGIIIRPVQNLPEQYIRGMDVSELAAQENSSVVYYDEYGHPQDVFETLSGYGINCIRLRVWNDPFDAEGHGYGGGNINAETAAELGARAARYGISTLIDFHYSDFWADPARQLCPKAWEGMSLEEKREALYRYTREALIQILDAGTDVWMVQIGNETNHSMAGEDNFDNVLTLMAAGCRAVREVSAERGLNIQTSIHLTDVNNRGEFRGNLDRAARAGLDIDAVAISWYPYWHGTFDDLSEAIRIVREEYGKEAFVTETSYPFTLEDGDGNGNVIADAGILPVDYPASVQGQASMLRDIFDISLSAGALGVFYWGGIWIPVGSNYETNFPVWEEYGSGWATSYSRSYDPENVGDFYGGSAWDNQAMFGFDGKPLESMHAFDSLKEGYGEYEKGSGLPDEQPQDPQMTDGKDPEKPKNYVRNPGFEEEDLSMWNAVSMTDEYPLDYQDYSADAHSGTIAFHYWFENNMEFYIEQTVSGLEEGMYKASVFSQGGDMGTDSTMTFYVITGTERYETSFMNTSWAQWQNPEIADIPVQNGELTIGVSVRCPAKAWGTLDDFTVEKQ